MAVNYTDFDKIWASTSPLTPYSFSESNYKQGWNFIGSTPPARQMWDFLQKQNDEKMQYLANNYLPLSGGTMTGELVFGSGTGQGHMAQSGDYFRVSATKFLYSDNPGAGLVLRGRTATTDAGAFSLEAQSDSGSKTLVGKPNGTLTWDNNDIITSAGGTVKGDINADVKFFGIKHSYNTDDGQLSIFGGNGNSNGAYMSFNGKNYTTNAGAFTINAHNGTNSKQLQGKPDGTFTWNGQPIQTSSDKRLKQDFSDVPADVLEAWSKVEWKQFKYKDDVKRKGDSCRWHTGLVAQDVQEVCGDKILKYGILCHDVQEATEEQEAVDLWTVRYTEALCMEVIYLRSEIKKLHEEIKALRTE